MISRLLCLSLILATVFTATPASAQSEDLARNREAEAFFERALASYIQGNYVDARNGFQSLVQTLPANQRTSASRLMLAKSLYELKEYNLAFAAAVELYDTFPYSRYLPEADLVIGDCKFAQDQIYSAATQYAHVLTGKGDLRLKARAANRLGQMAGASKLSDREVSRLKADFGKAIIEEAIAFGLAQWPLKLGQTDDTEKQMAHFLEQFPNGALSPLARQSVVRRTPLPQKKETSAKPDKPLPQPALLQEPVNARYKIGIIAPMETPAGRDLRDGILLARETHRLASGEDVGLVFKDSEGSPIRAVKAAQSLIQDHNVIAVIGALTSAETMPIAALVGALHLPLIAPTASEDGIASINPYVFQVNATPGAQGRRIADYTVANLGLRTLSTLASRDSYGERIAREFTARAEELGAEVIVQGWYEPGTTDYRGQFERIRDAGLALRPPKSLAVEIDSILQGSVQVQPPPPIPVDPDTVEPEPVETLEGLLVVGGRDDVLLIAPQVAFHQIRARLLGSDGWNHPDVARDPYANGAVFVSKYFDQSEIPSVREFVDAFRTRFQRDQSIAAALGYDAMHAVLTAMNAGATDPESLRNRLENLGTIPGATGRIAFSKGSRENAWMYLLAIRRKKIVPLTDDLLEPPVNKQ